MCADPALAKERLQLKKEHDLGSKLSWSDEDMYGYPRAFTYNPPNTHKQLTILDPTAGGRLDTV